MDITPNALARLVHDLATTLKETDHKVLIRLMEVAANLGERRCRQVLSEAYAVQALGGQARPDGTGPRTLGGIFFNLAKRPTGDDLALPALDRTPTIQPRPMDEMSAMLRHIAARASAAADLFPLGGTALPEKAKHLISDVRSLVVSLDALLRRSGKARATNGKPVLPAGKVILPQSSPPPPPPPPRALLKPPGIIGSKKGKRSLPVRPPISPKLRGTLPPSLRDTGHDPFDPGNAMDSDNRVFTPGSGHSKKPGSRRDNRGHK